MKSLREFVIPSAVFRVLNQRDLTRQVILQDRMSGFEVFAALANA